MTKREHLIFYLNSIFTGQTKRQREKKPILWQHPQGNFLKADAPYFLHCCWGSDVFSQGNIFISFSPNFTPYFWENSYHFHCKGESCVGMRNNKAREVPRPTRRHHSIECTFKKCILLFIYLSITIYFTEQQLSLFHLHNTLMRKVSLTYPKVLQSASWLCVEFEPGCTQSNMDHCTTVVFHNVFLYLGTTTKQPP